MMEKENNEFDFINKVLVKVETLHYHYDLEKLKEYVISISGIWEYLEPPAGIKVYVAGTVVEIGNDAPFIGFEGDIAIAQDIHNHAIVYEDVYRSKKIK